MCGISIIINNKNSSIEDSLIKRFNNKVSHRGPDDDGVYHSANFAFGHRRLSILDLTQAGHQPMQRDHLWITYNGEIYNYLELRSELVEEGYTFTSGSDTEVILAAYAAWGTDSFARFNGMWAFAIYDANRQEIIFSRDHFGIKPLYFAQVENYFAAGSEIKQFTAIENFKPVLNRNAAINFLVSGALNYSDQTFFQGVHELRPGHYLRYNLKYHTHEVIQWYDVGKSSTAVTDSYPEAVKKVRALFSESVRIRMRSDVRVGSCLSGGIDSSSIVSIIHHEQMANEDFATVTSCYHDRKFDEQYFSDLVTHQTNFKGAKVFPDLNRLLDEGHLDKMIYHQDQPFSGASHYSEFNVFKEASEQRIIVMQDGQGSDEFLCGYGEFYRAHLKELARSFKLNQVYKLLQEKSKHNKRSLLQEIKSFMHTSYGHPLIQVAKKILGRSNYPWLTPEWTEIADKNVVSFGEKSVRDLSILEIVCTSIPYQLHSEDRNSMLFSIESRLPFLDPRLVEYCIGLPSDYKIRNGYSKAVLRDAIPELPEAIRTRKDKMGFVAPDPSWILANKDKVRTDLENIVQTMPIFSQELLNRFDRFVRGELGYEPIYFRAMTFSRFCRIFNINL